MGTSSEEEEGFWGWGSDRHVSAVAPPSSSESESCHLVTSIVPVWSSIVMLIFVAFISTSRITPTTMTCGVTSECVVL